jgi:hypothetical protein
MAVETDLRAQVMYLVATSRIDGNVVLDSVVAPRRGQVKRAGTPVFWDGRAGGLIALTASGDTRAPARIGTLRDMEHFH